MNQSCMHNKEGRCALLTSTQCARCSFRLTEAQAAESRRKADARLRTLPVEAQLAIATQYYRGKMPWKAVTP